MTVELGMPAPATLVARRKSRQLHLNHARSPIKVGGDAPVSVQSMTTTVTADVNATLQQIAELTAGCRRLARSAGPSPGDA